MSSKATAIRNLAGRYADALFDLAVERGELEAVEKDAQSLAVMFESSADLRRVASSPTLPRCDQASAFAALSQKAGFCLIMQNFLRTLAANRRLAVLAESMRVFLERVMSAREDAKARVVSAVPLSDGQREAFARLLTEKVGHHVSIHSHVDPSILGGLIVYMGSKMVDNSVRTKLQRLRVSMKGVG